MVSHRIKNLKELNDRIADIERIAAGSDSDDSVFIEALTLWFPARRDVPTRSSPAHVLFLRRTLQNLD